jgi:hypothetical protein
MITITFNPTSADQAAILAEAMKRYLAVDVPAATEAPKKTRAAKPEAAAPAPTEAPAPVETEAPAPKPAATVKLEDVRSVLATLSQNGKAGEVKRLLGEFGYAKLTDVPEDRYADLLAAAEAL